MDMPRSRSFIYGTIGDERSVPFTFENPGNVCCGWAGLWSFVDV